ncbi:MAG: hypothetical protein [Circular genetic element sp.]|nr:MAG: hypothetical protein [Circular genetic element sp.]
MFPIDETRSTYYGIPKIFCSETPLHTIMTINVGHSSSSLLQETCSGSTVVAYSFPKRTTAGRHVHFPSRFTRQYNFAMYTRCIHDY